MALTNVASGATKVTKVLNANLQEVTMWCAGLAKVGIGIWAMTGANVLTVYGSQDGLAYNAIQVGAFPEALSGPGGGPPVVGTTTLGAVGNWEVPVQNYNFIRVQLTTGSGPVTVVMAGSVDGSYQEAYLNQATQQGVSLAVLFPSTSSSGGLNTMTLPPQANKTVNLTWLEVAMVGPGIGGNAQLRIWDGAVGNGTSLYSCFLVGPVGSVGAVQEINLPRDAQGNRSIQASPGNAMVIQIVNLGSNFAQLNARQTYL